MKLRLTAANIFSSPVAAASAGLGLHYLAWGSALQRYLPAPVAF